MKKYLSFFRLRFLMGLQYRAAALGGIATQFVWGFMEIMIFRAFYRADAAAFPMSLCATASYIWLQQAFLALFATWMMEKDVFDSIVNGNIAYELCRPVSIYNMWFSRSMATRLSRAVLRCFPILAIAIFVPQPYGICPARKPLALYCVSCDFIFGTGDDSIPVRSGLHIGFFHHIPSRASDDIHYNDRFLRRRADSPALFSGENAEHHGTSSLCGYAERSPSRL